MTTHLKTDRPNEKVITVEAIPAFNDNYIWMIRHNNNRNVFVVDPGDAAPVLKILQNNDITLAGILVTHHHADHIGGIPALLAQFPVPVYGPQNPAITCITHRLKDGESLTLEPLALTFSIIETPGHTLDHIAYYTEDLKTSVSPKDASVTTTTTSTPKTPTANPMDGATTPALFCGDTLFSAGCGRLFEGTPQQMHHSLQRLAALPSNTLIYCTHEYTLANLAFATTVEPDNQDISQTIDICTQRREQDDITLPSTLEKQLSINPFLRVNQSSVRESLAQRDNNLTTASSDTEYFAQLRQWKDTF